MQEQPHDETKTPTREVMHREVIAKEDGRKLYSYRFTSADAAQKEQTP